MLSTTSMATNNVEFYMMLLIIQSKKGDKNAKVRGKFQVTILPVMTCYVGITSILGVWSDILIGK